MSVYFSINDVVDIKVLQNLRHQGRLKDRAAFLNMREVLGILQLFHVNCHSSFLYDIVHLVRLYKVELFVPSAYRTGRQS
jgi:hypothetical protein